MICTRSTEYSYSVRVPSTRSTYSTSVRTSTHKGLTREEARSTVCSEVLEFTHQLLLHEKRFALRLQSRPVIRHAYVD